VWRHMPPGAEELSWEWDGSWAARGGSLPCLAGLAHRVLAQHRFAIKKLPFKVSDHLLIANLFEFKMSLNFE
jgi:hypothetical protein